ncbi:MAG: hypothetical protein HZB24_02535, partial [Desulfobacterales bacterium]|nr:hypothetical protein [Desulfobacterales bacterium]
ALAENGAIRMWVGTDTASAALTAADQLGNARGENNDGDIGAIEAQ